MKKAKFLGIFILAVWLLSGCSQVLERHTMRILAFGTWVDITVFVDRTVDKAVLQQQLQTELHQMHKDWHAWHPSELTRLNEAFEQGKAVTVDAQMLGLLKLSQQLEVASDGYFDAGIGKLLKLWGFQRDDPFNVDQLPDPKALQALMAKPASTLQMHFEGNLVSSPNPIVALDFGGFGKGFGIDLLIEQLKKQGINNALMNAGGDLRAIGVAGDRPWKIGIRDPHKESPLAILSLSGDVSVFTSGDYERGYTIDGVHYHHILNPKTGYPAHGIASATVIGDKGAWMDAAATTMLIAGVEQAFSIAPKMGVKHLLLVTDDGKIYLDKEMLPLLTFNDNQKSLNFRSFSNEPTKH